MVQRPAEVSTDGGKTWAEAPEPPTTGTSGPQPAAPAKTPCLVCEQESCAHPGACHREDQDVAFRRSVGAVLLEAAASLARLGVGWLEGSDLDEMEAAGEVAAACACALQPLRPPQGELTLRLEQRTPGVALALRGLDVNPQCVTARGGYHTVSVYPPDEQQPQWYVLESGYLKLGDVQVELRLPPRPATPEEIERHKARLDDLATAEGK